MTTKLQLKEVGSLSEKMLEQVERAVVGKREALELVLLGLLADGHVLIEDYPGLAKTLIARSFAQVSSMKFARIQFTPDLMPSDVTGGSIYSQRDGAFKFQPGPAFTNLLLGDEINRAPPKTQAALLEAMQERQITIDGETHRLDPPFLVLATQNPIEYEGTYPLPEAQLDRFLLKIELRMPERDAEIEVLRRHAAGFDPRDLAAAGVHAVASLDDLAAARAEVQKVTVDDAVLGYIADVCRATRSAPSTALGVSPRGATALVATSRAWAWLSGRSFVTPDDVKTLSASTLRHRIKLRAEAELEGVTPTSVLDGVLASVPVPR